MYCSGVSGGFAPSCPAPPARVPIPSRSGPIVPLAPWTDFSVWHVGQPLEEKRAFPLSGLPPLEVPPPPPPPVFRHAPREKASTMIRSAIPPSFTDLPPRR